MRGSQSTGSSPVQVQIGLWVPCLRLRKHVCLSRESMSTQAWTWHPAMAIAVCLSLLLFASGAWASYGTSPVGSPTLPPSSYEGGLVTNPNPLDNSSNSVITGNVRGGKQFRGPIPYEFIHEFPGPAGLDSARFLPEVFRRAGGTGRIFARIRHVLFPDGDGLEDPARDRAASLRRRAREWPAGSRSGAPTSRRMSWIWATSGSRMSPSARRPPRPMAAWTPGEDSGTGRCPERPNR